MIDKKQLIRNLSIEYNLSGCTFDGIADMIMLRDERIQSQEELIRELLPPRKKEQLGTTITPENIVRLLLKVEEAILMASELGECSFDAVEGRGLYHLRLEIQKIIRGEEG